MVDEILEDVHHVRWNVVERDGGVATAGSSVCLAEENVFWRQHPSLCSSTSYSILITSGYLLYATYPASFFPLPGRKFYVLKRSREIERIGKAALHESLLQWRKSHRFFVSILILRFIEEVWSVPREGRELQGQLKRISRGMMCSLGFQIMNLARPPESRESPTLTFSLVRHWPKKYS